MFQLFRRQHIQDHDSATNVTEHWGYPSRVVPCVNDVGSCQYLDAVYWMHDTSMLYSFILWAVIGSILLIWLLGRTFKPSSRSTPWDWESQKASNRGVVYRAARAFSAQARRWLLPESMTRIFGHTSRIQLLVLAVLSGYLIIFSFVGIVYKTWVTPVKNSDKFNTRTGLGGFSDRIGVLAYALTPFSVLLSSRESILSIVTGIPYHHFNFLHRWLGRIIFIQSFVHTVGWIVVEARLYQPQPKVWNTFVNQPYIIWGWVAMILITFLYVFSIRRVIRWTGYEFFRKTHYIVAGLYFGACWAHWARLVCWMIAALGLFLVDRGVRLLRTCLIHFGYKHGERGFGFRSSPARVQAFVDPESTVLRVTFEANHDPWAIGQHYFVCFPELSIWQSHPFTPASVPNAHPALPEHTYIIRALGGQTAKLAQLAQEKEKTDVCETPVIITGPYGTPVIDPAYSHILAIAGGTGISFTLPIAMAAATRRSASNASVHLVWIIRHADNISWLADELTLLKDLMARGATDLKISIYITRDASRPTSNQGSVSTKDASLRKEAEKTDNEITTTSTSISSGADACCCAPTAGTLLSPSRNFSIHYLADHHPSMPKILDEYIADTLVDGPIQVAASGPPGLGADIRQAVASRNSGARVWRGDWSADVDLVWDDRAV
ncbi:hypothetical protein EJ05DRAFT_361255 [Pseudovirgaria hyperparasitica]|uniref:ferric-chelate reductase (NADPH) n=1 Tax=Pseudovirgaria hyperparasitica TaxID=470096 RepID=A0A6A6W753_9PEZI|nr:uncharacterized protein EJ05DRAFT_361255 [Pseudovirgaria hyperparasitica]KAF2758682.1 hypothetical protein EJ05DRAFT_361255 [Pseudovirgaria hyperparasitica]